MLAASMHWLARPLLFTHLLTLVFAWQLRGFQQGACPPRQVFFSLPPLMVLWVNLHGAFMTGLVLVAMYTLGSACSAWRQSNSYMKAITLAVLLLFCLAASFANPNGWKLHAQILSFLHSRGTIESHYRIRVAEFSHGRNARLSCCCLLMLGVNTHGRASTAQRKPRSYWWVAGAASRCSPPATSRSSLWSSRHCWGIGSRISRGPNVVRHWWQHYPQVGRTGDDPRSCRGQCRAHRRSDCLHVANSRHTANRRQ